MDSLHADGVLLRAWETADAAGIASICGDPDVSAWDHLPWEDDPAAVAAWVQRQRAVHASGERLSLAIADPDSRAVLGWIGLSPHSSGDDAWSLGYWVLPKARRRGHGLRAASALVAHAFARGPARRVLLETGRHNAGSQAIAERLGGRLLGHRRAVDRTGTEHDQLVFEISAP